MIIKVVSDYETLSRTAAQVIEDEIRRNPGIVIGLAAGNTPLGAYRELVRMHREEGLDFAHVVVFNLDEYAGLEPTHPSSFTAFLHHNFLDLINARKTNLHLLKFPDPGVTDSYCEAFEEELRLAGGLDLQILGIGRNAHIAFNEPGSSFKSRTRVVNVIEGGALEFPKTAITMGIGTILESRKILLLASGESKAEPLASAFEGEITESVPASALQLHGNVVVIADEASASRLTKK